MRFNLNRRQFIAASALLAGSPLMPKAWAFAPGRDPRLLVIILRGGLDGLAALMPVGDPAFSDLRAGFGNAGKAPFALDGMFQMNGNMPALAALYRAREATFFHAIASPYRERSHFDAQEVLESGLPRAGTGPTSGWLNRALTAVPSVHGERLGGGSAALAVSATTPLILRGPAPVESWQPQVLPYANADLSTRLLSIYDGRDPDLAAALKKGIGIDDFLESGGMMLGKSKGPADLPGGFPSAAQSVARLMARPDGPRIAVLNYDGWDTHAMEGAYEGRLAVQLAALDAGVQSLHTGLGALWRDTAVLILTEFGRTVHVNGTRGTDHGTGGVAFLIGGAVNGGRVIADWPGLSEQALYQGRDLRPTLDLRAPLKGLLQDYLGLPDSALGMVFPDSATVQPMSNLLRS